MGLFNRNKNNKELNDIKEEVNNIKEEINNIKTETNKLNENINNTKTKIENNQKQDKEKIDKEKIDKEKIDKELTNQESKIENIDLLLTKLQETQEHQNNKLIKLQKSFNKLLNILQVTDLSEKQGKKHLYEFYYSNEPYSRLSLEGNKIRGARGILDFTITDIISLKENLSKYHEENYSLMKISKIHNIKSGSIRRVIWNIEEGNFDEIIEEYQNNSSDNEKPLEKQKQDNEKPLEKQKHKLKMADRYKVEFKRAVDSHGAIYTLNGKKMPYDIEDIIELKRCIEDENNHTISDVLKTFDYSYTAGCRLIWNIEEGNFDKLIDDWKSNCHTNYEEFETTKRLHLRRIPKSLQSKLPKNIIVIEGGELYSKNWGRNLSYTIQDVLLLQERIPDFNKYPTFKELFEGFELSLVSLKTLVWRIEEGCFDDLISEYLSRNYTYENNFNRLFIDGQNTGLSIDKCISIIELIINSTNKTETVNRLIKMYPTINSKYIRILSEEYDNINLSKVLKKEVRKIPKINNPQKRRELGVY